MVVTPEATTRRTIAALVLFMAVAACGASQSVTTPGTSANGVTAATVNATPAIAFTPASVNLAVGGTVTFAFGAVGHNVFFDGAPAGAPAPIDGVNANTNVQRTFATAGTYNYNCHIHPGMHGTIVVGTNAGTTMKPDSSYFGSDSTVP
jgi:plastocyanin